jgi:hypothetical protein
MAPCCTAHFATVLLLTLDLQICHAPLKAGPAPFYNKSYHVETANNTFSFPIGVSNSSGENQDWGGVCKCWPKNAPIPCPVKTFADWQQLGNDVGSIVQTALGNAAIIAEARVLLELDPMVP